MEFAPCKEPSAMRPSTQVSFARWLGRNKFLSRLITILLVILVVLPLLTHYYLTNSDAISYGPFALTSCDSVASLEPSELKTHLEELCRIRTSVSNELREMESRRQTMNTEMSTLYEAKESVQSVLHHSRKELDNLRLQVSNIRKEKEVVALQAISHIVSPKRILPGLDENVEIVPPGSSTHCQQHNCFDYSRCSVTSHFPVYFYRPSSNSVSIDASIRTSLTHILATNPYITFDAHMACVYLVAIEDTATTNTHDVVAQLESNLHKLPHWNGDGRNHVLLNLQKHETVSNTLKHVNTGRALVVQTNFEMKQFRTGFDIVAPMLLNLDSKFDWVDTPFQVPALRTFFLTFQGQRFLNVPAIDDTIDFINMEQDTVNGRHVKSDMKLTKDEAEEILFITDELNKLKQLKEDKFYIDFTCSKSNVGIQETLHIEWGLCDDQLERASILQQSTYALIISNNNSIAFSTHLYRRLYEALRYGAIPVIIGEQTQLPLNEFISWKKCVITLPKSRITELYFFLKTISDSDVLAMRRQGWFVWSTYLSSTEAVTDAILATVRTRISIPASILPSEPSPSVFPSGSPKKQETIRVVVDPEELLGPVEPPSASPQYLRNYTTTVVDQEYIWNNPPGPEYLFPSLPNDPFLPTDARFIGSELGFRPVGGGGGGAGKEFLEAIGGNVPKEQFTIVMLTYEREAVLMTALERLVGLPYLNKVVVVWNSPESPSDQLIWPQIHVPIKVIKTKKKKVPTATLR